MQLLDGKDYGNSQVIRFPAVSSGPVEFIIIWTVTPLMSGDKVAVTLTRPSMQC